MIERRDLHAEDPPPGTAYWITGLPGAGKKTLARALADRLSTMGRSVVCLDGAQVRAVLAGRFGFGLSERRAAASIYGRLCEELTHQGHDVVISTVSMFHEAQRWNRRRLADYVEIYLRATPALIAARHPKGLVGAALAGRIRNVPGVDLAIEEPEAPDVLIEVGDMATAQAIAEAMFAQLARRRAEPRADDRSSSLGFAAL